MCFSRKKKTTWQPQINRMTEFPLKFDREEIIQMEKKFKKMASSQKQIDKINFQKNMGIMGLRSVSSFSNRLFNSFDMDQDQRISFQDFLEYMEIIKCGSDRHKALLSFRLIDIKQKNQVNIEDFRIFLGDYYRSWISITNSGINSQLTDRTDAYVKRLFERVKKQTNKDVITFDYYQKQLYKDKQYMDALQFSQGATGLISQEDKKNKISNSYYITLKKLRAIYDKNFNQKQEQIQRQKFSSKQQKIVKEEKIQEQEKKVSFFRSFFQKKDQKISSQASKEKKSLLCGPENRDSISSLADNYQQTLKDEKIQRLQQKLDSIKNSLKQIIQENKEIYKKVEPHNKIEQEMEQFDIRTIIMNIPKNPIKKSGPEGKMILFGDEKWNLVLNMMVGIQMAVGSISGYQQLFQEQPEDFHLKYSFQLVPRRFGDEKKSTRICHFTDYAPNAFNHIRRIFKINNDDYIDSIGPSKLMKSLMMGELSSLTQLTSQGKSGSFFYYTTDGKYMLKTIQHREYKLLRNILKDYYFYLMNNPDSLLIKFFGLHRLEFKNEFAEEEDVKGKVYFVIMGNIFKTRQRITQRYDIKGSTYGRSNKSQDPNATKKDLDFLQKRPQGIHLEAQKKKDIVNILKKDAQFLEKHQIIDYSLLIGIFKKQSPLVSFIINKNILRQTQIYEDQQGQEGYIIGVIDILIEYEVRKKAEYHFKKLLHGEGVSAVPPDEYASRFIDFIDNKVFPTSSIIHKYDK